MSPSPCQAPAPLELRRDARQREKTSSRLCQHFVQPAPGSKLLLGFSRGQFPGGDTRPSQGLLPAGRPAPYPQPPAATPWPPPGSSGLLPPSSPPSSSSWAAPCWAWVGDGPMAGAQRSGGCWLWSPQARGVRSSEQGDVWEKRGFAELLASLEQGWVCELGLELNCRGVLCEPAASRLNLVLLLQVIPAVWQTRKKNKPKKQTGREVTWWLFFFLLLLPLEVYCDLETSFTPD